MLSNVKRERLFSVQSIVRFLLKIDAFDGDGDGDGDGDDDSVNQQRIPGKLTTA